MFVLMFLLLAHDRYRNVQLILKPWGFLSNKSTPSFFAFPYCIYDNRKNIFLKKITCLDSNTFMLAMYLSWICKAYKIDPLILSVLISLHYTFLSELSQ